MCMELVSSTISKIVLSVYNACENNVIHVHVHITGGNENHELS